MMAVIWGLLLALFRITLVFSQTTQAVIPDTRGREFLFAFPSNYGVPEALILQIGGLAVGETRAEVTVPSLGFEKTLKIFNTSVIAVNIPVEAACVGNGFQNRTVLVRTSRDVNIQAINSRSKSNDGFLVIPTDALGTEYFIASYKTEGGGRSQFVISAKSDLTRVTIVSERSLDYGGKIYPAGEKIIFGLQRGQSIQFQSATDLTGTHITADKAIAVLSGSTCAVVPEKTSRCDHLVEMIPAVDTWGKRFSLQPLLDRESGFVFRIIASRANTIVDVSGATVELHRQGQYMEFNQLAKFPLAVNANKPVLVMQYSKGMQTDGVGDPFMTIIPPIEQYVNGLVTFSTFDPSSGSNISSFAGISVTSPSLFTFYLNDVTVLASEPDLSLNGGMFSFGTDRAVPLSPGSHIVSNTSPDGLFSVIVYGFGIGTAYGFPAGYNLRKLTCSSTDPYTGAVEEFDCPIEEELPEGPRAEAQIGAYPCSPGQPCWPGQTPWIPGAVGKTWIPLPDKPPPEPLPEGVAGGNIPENLAPPPPPILFPGQPSIPPALLPPDQQTCYPVTAIIAAAAAPSIAVFLFMLVLMFAVLFSDRPWIPHRLRKSV